MQASQALRRAITERGGKRRFLLAADYVFGADLDRNVSEAVRADFSSFLSQAQSSGATVLALDNAGGDTTTALKQAAAFGLTKQMQVCGPIYNINVTKEGGARGGAGCVGGSRSVTSSG